MLGEKNKADRLSIATSLLSRQRNDPFLDKIITGDEKWITYDNVACKRQWVDEDKSPHPDPKPEVRGRKIMLYVWWDCRGIIHLERLNRNETVTADLYLQQLQRLLQTYTSSSYSGYCRPIHPTATAGPSKLARKAPRTR